MSYPEKDLKHCSDEELLPFLVLGEKTALSILFERYGTDLYIYIKGIVRMGVGNEQAQNDAQKVLRDVFISLSCYCQSAPQPFSLSDHLYASAYREAVRLVAERHLS
jgi:hypothetical protein